MRIKNQLSFLDASIKYKISPSHPLKVLFENNVKLTGDAAYDSAENIRGIKREVFIQDGKVFCPGGKEVYWGREKRRKRIKFRCPLFRQEEPCLFKSICWKGKYGRSFYIHEGKEIRERVDIIRCSPEFKEIFKKRIRVERLFSVLKNSHKLSEIRFRGMENIKIHVYLSIIAYLIRLITGKGARLVEM